MYTIPQSTAHTCVFKAYLASDHVSEATSKTIAITISKAGGAFGNPNAGATNATEISSGWYKVALDTTDTNTVGGLAIRGAVATIDDVGVLFNVVKATNGGLTALPDTAATTNASLLTSGTGTDQLSVTSGRTDIGKLLGTAWLTPGTAGTPDVNVKLWNALSTVALPLVPTTAGRTLDVSATGEAGVDWANVGSPTTSLALTGTTIAVTQKVDVDTIKTNPVVNAGTITFPTTATLASTTNITAGTVATATNVTTVNGLAANVITATSIAADAITAAKIADGAIDAATFAAGAIDATAIAANAIGASELATDAVTEIADGILARDIGSGSNAGSSEERTVRSALRFLRNKWAISGTTLTVRAEDDTTSMWTATVTASAGANPITANDPT